MAGSGEKPKNISEGNSEVWVHKMQVSVRKKMLIFNIKKSLIHPRHVCSYTVT